MSKRILSATIFSLAMIGGVSALAIAQDNPKGQLQLAGSWAAQNVTPADDGTVNLDFSATINNNGPNDVSGKILLRDYANNDKVWGRFGHHTIESGGSVTVSGNVTVPKDVYKSWSSGDSPSVYIYAENARGDVTAVNIALVKGAPAPPGK